MLLHSSSRHKPRRRNLSLGNGRNQSERKNRPKRFSCIQRNPLRTIKVGSLVGTPHGVGPIECWEVYPPLHYHTGGERKSMLPDILLEDPLVEGVPDGSFVRIGVHGAHPTLNLAFYTPNEITPL